MCIDKIKLSSTHHRCGNDRFPLFKEKFISKNAEGRKCFYRGKKITKYFSYYCYASWRLLFFSNNKQCIVFLSFFNLFIFFLQLLFLNCYFHNKLIFICIINWNARKRSISTETMIFIFKKRMKKKPLFLLPLKFRI